jgi:hypothetical protein
VAVSLDLADVLDPEVLASSELHEAAAAEAATRNVRRRCRIDRNLVSLVIWSMTASR